MKVYCKYASAALLSLSASVTAQQSAILQGAAEHCMRSLVLRSIPKEEKASHASFFFPAGTHPRVIRVVLGEAIATHAWDDSLFYLAVGGTVDTVSLAEGLRLILRNPPVKGKSKWPSVTIVYFSRSEDSRYLSQIAKEGTMKLRIEPLDMGSSEGLRESGCET